MIDAITEYRTKDAANYSLLSKLADHPVTAYKSLTKKEESTPFFDIGKFVDEGFWGNPRDSHYIIPDESMPTGKVKLIADIVSNVLVENLDKPLTSPEELDELIKRAATTVEYQSNWKPETIVEKLRLPVFNYSNLYHKATLEDKVLITTSQAQLAETLIDNIKQSPRYQSLIEGCELRFQEPIYQDMQVGDNRLVPCKVLPDIVVYNHTEKTVRIVDVKTCEGKFIENFYKYKYYYQGAFYSGVLFKRELHGNNYEVLPPVFVAADKSLYYPVRLFEQVDWAMLWDENGNYYRDKYKPIPMLLTEYAYHRATNDWSESYEALTTGMEKLYLR